MCERQPGAVQRGSEHSVGSGTHSAIHGKTRPGNVRGLRTGDKRHQRGDLAGPGTGSFVPEAILIKASTADSQPFKERFVLRPSETRERNVPIEYFCEYRAMIAV
jgi:hypothetical protein